MEKRVGRLLALLKKGSRQAQRGMTLLEIMVVVVIISLIMGVVGVTVLERLKSAEIATSGMRFQASY